MENYISQVIMAILTFVVAYVETKRNRAQIKTDKDLAEYRSRTEQRAELREKEAKLSMKMAYTTLKVADVTAFAVSGGKCNGNVVSARQEADEALAEYQDFIAEVACRQITKQ